MVACTLRQQLPLNAGKNSFAKRVEKESGWWVASVSELNSRMIELWGGDKVEKDRGKNSYSAGGVRTSTTGASLAIVSASS